MRQPFLRAGVALAGGVCALIVAGLIRPGPAVRWLGRRHPDILFQRESEGRLVALTFDDSPHPALTPRILDVLAEHDAHATFFVIGERVPGNEGIVRRMVAEGHELGNHMLADTPSIRLSPEEFERQLLQTHELLAPFGPIRWFRPGHGWFNRRMLGQVHSHGYRCAMASTYAFEFHLPSARYAARHILLNTHPGAVIVLHDGAPERERTVAVLRRILPELNRRGYRVVTLSELARENEVVFAPNAEAKEPEFLATEDGAARRGTHAVGRREGRPQPPDASLLHELRGDLSSQPADDHLSRLRQGAVRPLRPGGGRASDDA